MSIIMGLSYIRKISEYITYGCPNPEKDNYWIAELVVVS